MILVMFWYSSVQIIEVYITIMVQIDMHVHLTKSTENNMILNIPDAYGWFVMIFLGTRYITINK